MVYRTLEKKEKTFSKLEMTERELLWNNSVLPAVFSLTRNVEFKAKTIGKSLRITDED